MGDVLIKQFTTFFAGKGPNQYGYPSKQSDFELSGIDLVVEDLNESQSGRFSIDAAAVDVPIAFGTVSLAKVLVINPESDIDVKIVNGNGSSQDIRFIGGRVTVMHVESTSVLFTNPSVDDPVKGTYYVAGD